MCGLFYLSATEACFKERSNKKDLRVERAEDFCLGKPLAEVSGSLEVIHSRALLFFD
jgi:hypothetical protein